MQQGHIDRVAAGRKADAIDGVEGRREGLEGCSRLWSFAATTCEGGDDTDEQKGLSDGDSSHSQRLIV